MDTNDLILNVIGSLYEIVKCCYGLNSQYQMLVSDTSSNNDDIKDDYDNEGQTIILSKKASEILKSIKIEHVFSNIVKKSVQMLESICYDGTNTLVLLIYSIFRECVIVLDKGIHPISLIYSLQNSFTTVIEPTLKSLRIPLIPTLLEKEHKTSVDISLTNDEILKLKLKDIDLDLLYNTIYSVINTKLDNENNNNNNNNSNNIASNISKLCLDSLKSLYIENQEESSHLTVLDIMNNRISFQDQIIIYPRLILNNSNNNNNDESMLYLNSFIVDNNSNQVIKNSDNNYIVFINEELSLKSNFDKNGAASGLTKSNSNDSNKENEKDKTKLVFHSALARTEILDFEKSILKNKIIKLCKYLIKLLKDDGNSNIILVFKSIDEYSKSLVSGLHSDINFIIFDNIQQQHIKTITRSFGISIINSIDSLIKGDISSGNIGDQDDIEKEKKTQHLFKSNFIGKFNKITQLQNGKKIKLSQLLTKSPLISIEIYGSSNHILRQRVGSYVTGMGIGKCCFEDLFILPSACSPELSIIKSLQLKQQQRNNNEHDDNENRNKSHHSESYIDNEVYQALIKSIEIIPITLLSNQNNRPILKILDSFYNKPNSNDIIGINLSSDNSKDDYFINPIENGIFETFRSKSQTYRFAIDIVCLLLKIDQIIQPEQQQQHQQQQQQQSQQQSQQKSQQQQQQSNKKEYIEFKALEITTDRIEKQKVEETKKQNELFYSKEQVEKRERFDRKFNTNPFNK